jgi:ABC-type bacteriocin/lantibiotic exporter with double-glycine peptidase domain
LGVGGWRVIQGSLTLGSLVAFQSLAMSFSEPFANLVNYFGGLQTIKGSLERLEDVYKYPLSPQTGGDIAIGEFPPKLAGRVELRHISFGYSALETPSPSSSPRDRGSRWLVCPEAESRHWAS